MALRSVLSRFIDFACGLPTFERGRVALLSAAAGRVLEIGMGTGRNLFITNQKNWPVCVGLTRHCIRLLHAVRKLPG